MTVVGRELGRALTPSLDAVARYLTAIGRAL